ncbi:PadR family transcriptional regulator [Halorubellus sp. JP-L1]|uniref:PadR family transcriptional regulator n=1 Tax=Halorubellus sp. JP-L1 TaxID=2715753 RepID=UPI00140D7EEB|nr:PadR family transcriptional regulator [Halorubellus sp. JP-L1]NHN42576.1 PadR family transcriptional regulator [Halorubellus sp. JP-L1]
MTKYVQSGMRRDVLALLAADPRRGQQLKTALEAHYDEHIEPKTFYGALDALADAGHVTTETEGVHDVYRLTPGGRRMLEEHARWLHDTVEPDD